MILELSAISSKFAYLKNIIRYDVLSVTVVCLVLSFLALSNYVHHKEIVSSSHAGFALTSTFNHGFFANTTVIETDIGRYLVSGQIQPTKGQALVVEERADGNHLLCFVDDSVCNPLVL
jgi:hypothetical protein